MANQMSQIVNAQGKSDPKLNPKRFGIRREWYLALLLLFLPLSQRSAWAQVDTGSIVGTVVDASGAAVPGATLTLTDIATDRKLSQQSGEDGSYSFNPIKIGTYTLMTSKAGFCRPTCGNTSRNHRTGASLKSIRAYNVGEVTQQIRSNLRRPDS